MAETIIGILGVLLGAGAAGLLLLFGIVAALLLVIRELIVLVRWILGDVIKKKGGDVNNG